jgi:uncharacterized RmlC-like cupin family protein
MKSKIVVVHPEQRVNDREHGFARGWGVLGSTTGATAISMGLGNLPAGIRAAAHKHPFETAILILSGRARVHFGDSDMLDQQVEIAAGDFLFIPAGVIHSPETFGDEPMQYVVSRAAADEAGEEVKLHEDSDATYIPVS